MQVRNLLFTLFLLFAGIAQAENISVIATQPHRTVGGDTCDLAAPISFQVTDIGPTWVEVEWVTMAANTSHRIRVYESNGTLVATVIVPGGVINVTITGLEEGEEYYAVINSICRDGSNSIHELTTPDFKTIILELIVQVFPAETLPASCSLRVANEQCFFSGLAVHTFRVRQILSHNVKKNFGIQKSATEPRFFNYLLANNNPLNHAEYAILCDLSDPYAVGGQYQIRHNGIIIARFDISIEGNNLYAMNCIYMNSAYEIVRISTHSQGRPSDGNSADRDDSTGESLATASPNPFSETLDVFLPQPALEHAKLQLYNLSGQLVLDQSLPTGESQHSLSTAHLSPGFYFLRLEADGMVQTLKVVKSE